MWWGTSVVTLRHSGLWCSHLSILSALLLFASFGCGSWVSLFSTTFPSNFEPSADFLGQGNNRPFSSSSQHLGRWWGEGSSELHRTDQFKTASPLPLYDFSLMASLWDMDLVKSAYCIKEGRVRYWMIVLWPWGSWVAQGTWTQGFWLRDPSSKHVLPKHCLPNMFSFLLFHVGCWHDDD